MNKETLHFKITLSGTYFNNPPQYRVLLNDTEYASGTVNVPSDEDFFVEFETEVNEDSTSKLKIVLQNKIKQDTVTENDNIIADTLLNIQNISVDDIDLGILLWTHSVYHLDEPCTYNNETVSQLKNCVNLGFNGTYEFEFGSPFYLWLLENI